MSRDQQILCTLRSAIMCSALCTEMSAIRLLRVRSPWFRSRAPAAVELRLRFITPAAGLPYIRALFRLRSRAMPARRAIGLLRAGGGSESLGSAA